MNGLFILIHSKAHDIYSEQPVTFWSNEIESGTHLSVRNILVMQPYMHVSTGIKQYNDKRYTIS